MYLIFVKDLGSEFSIDNWPVKSDVAKESLHGMKTTHRPIPIPAYDVNGSLIAPSDYHRRLQGALAQIHFTLVHWSIREKEEKLDRYVADIYQIRILEGPLYGGPATPKRKRRTFHTDPLTPDLSPAKKLKGHA